MEKQKVIITQELQQALAAKIAACQPDRLFVLTDENTRRLCWPQVEHYPCLQQANVITMPAGDENKTVLNLQFVWHELSRLGATRHSLMVNLGGGMLTDLGGFAASTFKRGIHFINIPTTLLAMVDASVGGKTGVNFEGLKNEVGVFSNADCVILDTRFLQTLDTENLLSGYAEMLKHSLIDNSDTWAQLLNFDILQPDLEVLGRMVADSVAVKERIVQQDPHEQGLRKALNLGHTVGHAFESLALSNPARFSHQADSRAEAPILHGYAVAYGLVCELYLSTIKTGFPVDRMRQTVRFVREHYGQMLITCDDYPTLLQLMTHDKKNTGTTINFTLLGNIGDIRINQTATRQEIEEALDFYREG